MGQLAGLPMPTEPPAPGRVALVVDSAATLPEEALASPILHVAPMSLALAGRTYLDGEDVSPSEFYRMLRAAPSPPTTSAPSPATFLDAYRRAARDSASILCLTVASSVSASYESAKVAARLAADALPGVEVRVIDSESAAGGQGLVALEAHRLASAGAGLDEAAEAVLRAVPRVRLLAFPDTLYYLWKSGRVPGIAHAGSALLGVKPIFELYRGAVGTVARPRTLSRAIRRLVALIRERAGDRPISACVMHADSEQAALELRGAVEAAFECDRIFVAQFTPVMGAHIGPGLLGVAFLIVSSPSQGEG